MGAEGAVNILYRDELAAADDRTPSALASRPSTRKPSPNPYIAAGRGYLDDVIVPSETRPRVIDAFEMLEGKRDDQPRRKHGNIPL